MDKDESCRTERILHLTLEIIYLLTGEDYTVVKKTSGECETPSSRPRVSGGLSRTESPITVPPPHSLIHERHNDQKILKLVNNNFKLLTGEEGDYIEEHRGLFKAVMVENHRPLTSPDGASNKHTPERCPRPLYSQDCTKENHRTPQEHQDEVVNFKIEEIEGEEETYVRGDEQCNEEEDPTDISTADGCNRWNISENRQIFSPYCEIEDDITQYSTGEIPMTSIINPVPNSADMSCDQGEFSDNYDPFITSLRVDTIPCSIDAICFTQNSKLISHQPAKAEERQFSCAVCGKCFKLKSVLTVHERIHTGVKLFSCFDCGKCFTQKSNLVKHQKNHKSEKPFPCSECGKRFTRKSYLVIHQRSHTGEKPFPCSECGKCFTQKSNLVKHQKNHKSEKPFPCSECGKRFTHKSYLVTHQRSHTGEKPFLCSECGKCFTQKSVLVTHQRSHR